MSGGGALAELASLLKNPLKVEFANTNVGLNTHVNLKIDGRTIAEEVAKHMVGIQNGN